MCMDHSFWRLPLLQCSVQTLKVQEVPTPKLNITPLRFQAKFPGKACICAGNCKIVAALAELTKYEAALGESGGTLATGADASETTFNYRVSAIFVQTAFEACSWQAFTWSHPAVKNCKAGPAILAEACLKHCNRDRWREHS